MEQTADQIARQLISQLTGKLAQHENAESAIDVYKTANWIISELDEVKETALDLAQRDMQQRGLDALRTPAGSAGWTEPKAKQLNEQAWTEALAKDPHLIKFQRDFDVAKATLEQAQEPFMELPEARFFIR
jgi:ribosomal protein L11 methylase PrmA